MAPKNKGHATRTFMNVMIIWNLALWLVILDDKKSFLETLDLTHNAPNLITKCDYLYVIICFHLLKSRNLYEPFFEEEKIKI